MMTRHHRKPKSLGGVAEKKNISLLPHKKHTAWHMLFSNLTPERIAAEINEKFLDPDYVLVVRRRNGM